MILLFGVIVIYCLVTARNIIFLILKKAFLFHEIHNVSMMKQVGEEAFNEILAVLCVLQGELVQNARL